MIDLFPQLAGCKVSHSWHGFVGYTFDNLPHIGEDQGLHYAMGYCGSGIAMASYCGALMGERLSGIKERETALEALKFPARPYYFGKPWFVEPAVQFYRLKDALGLDRYPPGGPLRCSESAPTCLPIFHPYHPDE